MVNVQLCVKYESKLNISKIKEVKMDKTENGVKRSKYFPQFTASMGVEGLIHVVDCYFNKNATKLNFTTAEKWANFDEVLDSVAESKWTARITNIAPQAPTKNRLKSEIKWLIGSYAESDNPRDVLIEYLKGPSCKKTFSKSPQEHADRMEVLIRMANRLDGTAPNIDDSNTKFSRRLANRLLEIWKCCG